MKTGGTTFSYTVAATFGFDGVWFTGEPESRRTASRVRKLLGVVHPDRVVAAPPAELDGVHMVTGHHPAAVADVVDERLGRRVPRALLLRDPVERVVSHVRHLRTILGMEDRPLEAVYDEPVLREGPFTNLQTKALAATAGDLADEDGAAAGQALVALAQERPDALPELREPALGWFLDAAAAALPEPWSWEHLVRSTLVPGWARTPVRAGDVDRAADRLGDIDVLGSTSRMERFVGAVEQQMGWRLPQLDAQRVAAADDPVPGDLLERIAADNAADLDLWERAAPLLR